MTTPQSSNKSSPVLILGGGIHGAAVARELVLNGVPVVLVDSSDLAAGATSKSSRLIHGGLRYLEYGDVGLVRESLVERGRLLRLAPHLVQPLRLFVPTSQRWSGLLRSVFGFFKLARTRLGRWFLSRSERKAPRGYWPVRIGLWMYDLFSWRDGLPKSRGARIRPQGQEPKVDSARYRWLVEYSDAQMLYPERCVFALLAEAEHLAHEKGVRFEILPHANIQWQGEAIAIQPTRSSSTDSSSMSNWHAEADSPRDEANDGCEVRNDLPSTHEFEASVCEVTPVSIVNVSGAWGDMTLKGIDAGTTPLFAGTKGSHFVTRHPVLKAALGGNGVYAETADRRLCFLLPFDDAVLIGTTDERWSGPPDTAVASDEELDYLLSLVQTVFGLTLSRSDVESHYSGVRPLPRTNDSSNAAVSRDHHLTLHRLHGVPILTLVGGKLTTFRSVGEQIADRVFKQIGVQRLASTRDMPLFGAEGFSDQVVERKRLYAEWADEFESPPAEVAALWKLYGMRTKFVLSAVRNEPIRPIADTPFTSRVVRWVIEHEWVTTLDDLIERRMMLIFAPTLTMASLHDLAGCLVETGRLREEDLSATVDATRQRLQVHYGRVVG